MIFLFVPSCPFQSTAFTMKVLVMLLLFLTIEDQIFDTEATFWGKSFPFCSLNTSVFASKDDFD